jgi:hypothetical protein
MQFRMKQEDIDTARDVLGLTQGRKITEKYVGVPASQNCPISRMLKRITGFPDAWVSAFGARVQDKDDVHYEVQWAEESELHFLDFVHAFDGGKAVVPIELEGKLIRTTPK